MSCLFCKICSGEVQSRIIWQNKYCLSILTPFPNTQGFTVVLTKEHLPSDVLQLNKTNIRVLMEAAQETSALLRSKLNVARVGLICEGYGIDHAHVKLIPMHGIVQEKWQPIVSADSDKRFYSHYPGFIASHDGPRATDEELDRILQRIIG